MTPIVRSRPGQKVQPTPQPPAPPSTEQGRAEGPLLKVPTDSPLVKILQSSGRTPTHPLTAKAAPAIKKVTPVDIQKSEQALRQAEVHAERGRLEETYQALEKAYSLNPDNEKIVDGLAQILTVGGQAVLAHGVLTEFLERHPDSLQARAQRLALTKQLIPQLGFLAEKFPQEEKYRQDLLALSALATIDQTLIFRAQAPSIRQELKAFEKNSEKIHALELKTKGEILDSLQMTSETLLGLSASPVMTDPEGQPIAQELKALSKEISDVLHRFIENDQDPKIRALIPISKAKQALAEGRHDEALSHFEAYREAECKVLGGGDAQKGLAILREKYDAASAHVKNNNEAEAEKVVEGISPNLLLAHRTIEEGSAAKLRQANLAALAAWREEIIADAQARRENVGSLDKAWDRLWRPETTEADKILKQETTRLNLTSAVRARLESGQCKTILEALKDVYAGSDAELKDAALEVLAGSGLYMPFGNSRAGRLAAFGSSTQPNSEDAARLLKDADELAKGNEEQKKAAAGIYRMVYSLSRDAAQKEEARQALEAK